MLNYNKPCNRGHVGERFRRVNAEGYAWLGCRACDRERNKAYRDAGERGYEPDQAAIERHITGTHTGYVHYLERREAVRVLRLRGVSYRKTAQLVRCDPRNIAHVVGVLKKLGEL